MDLGKYFQIFGQIHKRATVIVALFLCLSSSLGVQAATETYKDIIEKAYNLSLQKDRTQAVGILLSALKRESKKTTAQKELMAALTQVSSVFYSDKAQQLYELGLSLRASDMNLATSKLQEASRLEPENTAIETALIRQMIAATDCDGAFSRAQKLKEQSLYIEDLRLASAQSAVCAGKFEDYNVQKAGLDLKKSELNLFWLTIECEYDFRTGAFARVKETAQTLQKLSAAYPEGLYWQWKAEVETKQRAEKEAQKYLSTCKTLNGRQQREFSTNPQLCRHTPEVENYLKKNNNSEI